MTFYAVICLSSGDAWADWAASNGFRTGAVLKILIIEEQRFFNRFWQAGHKMEVDVYTQCTHTPAWM